MAHLFPEILQGYHECRLDRGKFEGAHPLVPTRLAKMYPSVLPLCFRGCQMPGTMCHIWWECPRIWSYWNGNFALTRRVTGQLVPQTPQIALLNTPVPGLPKYLQLLIFFILLGAKMTLVKIWKQSTVSLAQAKKRVTWIM